MITRPASTLLLTSFLALLAGPVLSAQAFSFGPPHFINFSSPVVVFQNAAFDMNGDGNTDLFVALNTGNFIYVGDGKGNFAAPIAAGGTSNDYNLRGLSFYDVNGDGFDDEVFSSPQFNDEKNVPQPGVFAVLLGDGKGNFTQTTSIPNNYTGEFPNTPSIAAGDFNHDGKIDFVTVYANFFDNLSHAAVNVYLNEGKGVFVSAFSAEIPGFPTTPAVGDFNGDGNLDIVWLDGNPQPGTTNRFAVHCIYGNGDGTFQPDQICYTLDGGPFAVAAADFNHDGMTDLLVLDAAKTGVTQAKPRLATLLAKKGGFFWSSAASLPVVFGDPPFGNLQLIDMNGDGIPDALANLGANGIFKGNANGVFNNRVIVQTNAFTAPFFAPLAKGQLPALFHIDNDQGDFSTQITFNLNTSPK